MQQSEKEKARQTIVKYQLRQTIIEAKMAKCMEYDEFITMQREHHNLQNKIDTLENMISGFFAKNNRNILEQSINI